MSGADSVKVFRLVPVPMRLDDPRWRWSWWRKPCLVVHVREELARATAARIFHPSPVEAPFQSPWTDPDLVTCSDGGAAGIPTQAGAVFDLGGGPINRRDVPDEPAVTTVSARTSQIMTYVLIGVGILIWLVGSPPSQIAQVREQSRTTVAELRSRHPDGDIASNPLLLFQASLAEAAPAAATVRGTVYVPAYSAMRVGSGRGRIELATTLSIHNTSRDKPLLLERVDYHNTEGELVQAHLDKPVALKPLGTIEMFVANEDLRGGTGANFVVDWAADGPMSEPVVEAVMIGVVGTTSYSFVSQGRNTRLIEPE
ncbi:MAG TPA: DUF3124 domain-containing protein [Microvirga sp.]|nr:DUF3124 domain-containing protein [Microvirga sp.]